MHRIEYCQGLPYVSFPELTKLGFINAITTRLGGVSPPPYDKLNLGFHTGDDPEFVLANRIRVSKTLGFPLDSFVIANQVHSTNVAIVTEEDKGRGARDQISAIPNTDALITKTRGLLLGGFFADCVPIFLVDVEEGAMGLVHAGWRGTAGRIVGKTVKAMQKNLGSKPTSLVAAIGPSIGPCCYRVKDDVIAKIEASLPEGNHGRPIFYGDGYLDLWEVNRRQLLAAGLVEDRITITSICTSCQVKLFYSHRAQGGLTGRLGAFIGRLSSE